MIFRQKVTDGVKESTPTVAADMMNSETTGTPVLHSFQRTGCMAAFESFAQFENYADEILDLLEARFNFNI